MVSELIAKLVMCDARSSIEGKSNYNARALKLTVMMDGHDCLRIVSEKVLGVDPNREDGA